jgi:hypothetical protein
MFARPGRLSQVRVVASCGAGFLLAVLWFDLMFDMQVRGHGAELPSDVLDSIAAYYRRVTTAAYPMSRLIAATMLVTLGALIGEVALGVSPRWAAIASLVLVALAVGLAAARTVRSAVQLGAQTDSREGQSGLARAIYRDHVLCFVLVAGTVVLQIAVG